MATVATFIVLLAILAGSAGFAGFAVGGGTWRVAIPPILWAVVAAIAIRRGPCGPLTAMVLHTFGSLAAIVLPAALTGLNRIMAAYAAGATPPEQGPWLAFAPLVLLALPAAGLLAGWWEQGRS